MNSSRTHRRRHRAGTRKLVGVSRARLLERDAEHAAVGGLIERASPTAVGCWRSRAAGIGKTALLAEARALAQEAGLRVLSARGSELERSFSYGVVRQLFEPLLASQSADERAELLEGGRLRWRRR